jgi:hypothetical protein
MRSENHRGSIGSFSQLSNKRTIKLKELIKNQALKFVGLNKELAPQINELGTILVQKENIDDRDIEIHRYYD